MIQRRSQRHLSIPTTLQSGQKIIEHLNSLLLEALQSLGIIRPYNAAYGKAYRKKVMALFAKGEVQILICTDAAGMVTTLIFLQLTKKLLGMQCSRH
jgi:superfamily II DNA/RNA helicase